MVGKCKYTFLWYFLAFTEETNICSQGRLTIGFSQNTHLLVTSLKLQRVVCGGVHRFGTTSGEGVYR